MSPEKGVKARFCSVVTLSFALAVPNPAAAQGLLKAKSILESFKAELLTIIPVVAVIALLLLAVGYATKFVEKDTFVRWAIGVIIAGSAAQITALFFT